MHSSNPEGKTNWPRSAEKLSELDFSRASLYSGDLSRFSSTESDEVATAPEARGTLWGQHYEPVVTIVWNDARA
jgi:hypothetical protein